MTSKDNSKQPGSRPSLIDYKTRSCSGKYLQFIPTYEPEVKQSLHNRYPEIFDKSFLELSNYSFEAFNQTEIRWSQFAREWWAVSYKRILQTYRLQKKDK